MTSKQAMESILFVISSALGVEYPNLRLTTSLEDAVLVHAQGRPWVLITLQQHDPNRWQGEDNWQFLLQGSQSLQPGAQEDTMAANDADMELWDAIAEAVNGDDGYAALRAAGILMADDMTALPEDQQSTATINPHVLSCSTY